MNFITYTFTDKKDTIIIEYTYISENHHEITETKEINQESENKYVTLSPNYSDTFYPKFKITYRLERRIRFPSSVFRSQFLFKNITLLQPENNWLTNTTFTIKITGEGITPDEQVIPFERTPFPETEITLPYTIPSLGFTFRHTNLYEFLHLKTDFILQGESTELMNNDSDYTFSLPEFAVEYIYRAWR